MLYNCKIITYKTGEQDIRFYSIPIKKEEGEERPSKREGKERFYKELEELKEGIEGICQEDKERSLRTSLNRSKNTLYDYARANKWEYFITFTWKAQKTDEINYKKDFTTSVHLDKPKLKRADRYNYDDVSKKLSNWLKNIKKRKAGDLKYIIVAEKHKDGAYHFHGMFSNIGNLKLIDSGKKVWKGKNKGDVIYNIHDYKYGWTTATVVKDTLKSANYLTKYITKDLVEHTPNKKRLWTSTNLERGEEEFLLLDSKMMLELKNLYGNNPKNYKSVEVPISEEVSQRIEYYTIEHEGGAT